MIKAIVTGHSRGLGAAIAANLLARDIAVLGIARRGNTALAAAFPDRLAEVALDLADGDALAGWLAGDALAGFAAGAERLLLVNNAGLLAPVGALAAQPPDAIARAIACNVAAPLMFAAAAAKATASAAELRILHVSSGAGRNAIPGWSVYGAGKAALDHHARVVAADAAPGVRICSLAPGVIDTDMQAEIRATAQENFPLRKKFEALKESGSLATPAACAAGIVAHLLGERFGEVPVLDLREQD
ncbi:SDR family oxidoreductase [Azospira restricta]|uniref:SDR family oxidoreductase n=1 Tax=Azospira restricta TaxID=404405 RepID=A0A974PV51_9RHOO|nr:SDR family oxidoreductase [Azospira restricta]QRJ62117.1 SDR family oxidoreductase [Azospira restricta]